MKVEGELMPKPHGLFTAALVAVLESGNGKSATYNGVVEIIGRLRNKHRRQLGVAIMV